MASDEGPVAIYFTGTAGAGKTTLTHAFQAWMAEAGYDVATVNLDPGMEDPSFDPDVDVRDWVKLKDVMEENKLGPNGAQVAASDLLALRIGEVREALEPLKVDYLLVDTPGQVELFAFRESSKAIVEALSGPRSLIAFLFDPMLARHPQGFVSLLMLSATVQFRMGLPMVNLLAKSDLLSDPELETVSGWAETPESLYESILEGSLEREGVITGEFFKALESIGPVWSLIRTSSQAETGMEELYAAVQQEFAGGEDLEGKGSPPPTPE